MPDDATTTEPTPAQRDGTSQAARPLAALDPDYVAVDERSVRDLLAFAQDYARRLVYHPVDGSGPGDWSGFIPRRPGPGRSGRVPRRPGAVPAPAWPGN